MTHYRIFNTEDSQAEEGLYLNKQQAKTELKNLKKQGHDLAKFKIVSVEEAHRLHWVEERKLREALKLLSY